MLTHHHTFGGHQNPVYTLADGVEAGTFYSAGNDKGVVKWSLIELAFIKVLVPLQSSVYAMCRHEDTLFIAQKNGLILVLDLEQEKIIARLAHHQKAVFDLRVIRSKKELLSTGEDGTVAVWSINDFSLVYEFKVLDNTVRVIALSRDEKELALGCKDGVIRVYNSFDYGLQQEIKAHEYAITALSYAPDGTYLISGSRDARLKIWSLPEYREVQTVAAHMFAVYSIVFHPDLPVFATCSQDKSIKLWSGQDFRLYKILSLEKNTQGHKHSVNKLLWTPDGKFLISTGDDRQVMTWAFTGRR
ncbi:WD40 repeat domain-containing protein [Pedobacter deserti]|uniref:WD40 repeat domain-containing protein n=1 Tax=Pedobacter deserti TaxID=2817382 RepID=UPI00210B83DF|nr:WD40 repeat domain-containing protein [Pedobacter sp. SYSU D00382]